MFKLIAVLITLMLPGATYAGNIDTNISGFITGTAFSDSNWQPSSYSAATNVDIFYNDWAIRGQLAIPYEQPIRRLVVEKSFWLGHRQELLLQVGRFPRIDSFYNGITDTPGTAGMAMLPLGKYNYRLNDNRTFNTINGIQAIYSVKTDIGHFQIHGDYGKMEVEKQCDIQAEATKLPCRAGYNIKGENGNYDYGLTFSHGPWTALVSKGKIFAGTELLNKKDRVSVGLTTIAEHMSYDATKIGLSYNDPGWWLQTELMENKFNLAAKNKELVNVQTSVNLYVLGGIYWSDKFSSYAVYSHGKSSSSNGGALDRAIGSTYTDKSTTYSLEYHQGQGKAWEKYFAPNNSWNSWVISVTKSF